MTGEYVPIDEWFKANEEANEYPRSGIVDKLYEGIKGKRCRTPGCNIPVRGNREYCDKCHDSQLKRERRKARKQALIEMLEKGGE